MEKIKNNEYIKTKDGIIRKVINADYYMKIYVECDKGLYLKENIEKHSFELVDLVENLDILEIKISNEYVEKEDEYQLIIIGKTITKEELKKDLENGIYKIKSILTKEQFQNKKYELEEK